MSKHDARRPLIPASVTAYVDGIVNATACTPSEVDDVRRELLGYFEDALAGAPEGERADRANKLVAEFGKGEDLAALISRAKKRCRKEAHVKTFGVLGAAFVLVGMSRLSGTAPLRDLVELGAAIIVVTLACGLSLMSFGGRGLFRGLWAVRTIFVKTQPGDLSSRDVVVLKGMISHLYASAAVSFLSLLAVVLNFYSNDPARILGCIAVLLLCPVYALVLSEILLRPALYNVERILAEAAAKGIPAEPVKESQTQTA
jgi:hypothetical protein